MTGHYVTRFVPCGGCDPCRAHSAEVAAHHAARIFGIEAYGFVVSEAEWQDRTSDGVKTALRAAGARYRTSPLPGDLRAVITSDPVRPSSIVRPFDAARDAALTNPHDGRRVSVSCLDRANHPGRGACRGACAAPTLDEVEVWLTAEEAEEPGRYRTIGYHHAATVEAAADAAAEVGLPHEVEVSGIVYPVDADPILIVAYRRRIGFVSFNKSARHANQHELPIAEAFAYWKRWQETADNEPPAAVYDQLALEVAS